MSIFLAYATTFPDAGVLLFFVIPLKVKWLGVVYGGMIIYELFNCLAQGAYYVAFAIIASLANYVIFFVSSGKMKRLSPADIKRRQDFMKAMKNAQTGANAKTQTQQTGAKMRAAAYMHRCAICGRTDLSAPDLEFRYCSKCEGGYEYCQDHLFTHIHAAGGARPALKTEEAQTDHADTEEKDEQI